MPILPGTRRYNNKRYTLHDKTSTRTAAVRKAKQARCQGFNARVGPRTGTGRNAEYGIYRRLK